MILARGGSKRLPGKNIREFFGAPMISYAIKTAQNSRIFKKIFVSSDDHQILKISEKYGAIPAYRANFANDSATTLDAMAFALQILKIPPESLACALYPCTPLLRPETLVMAHEILQKNPQKNYVFPCGAYQNSPLRAFFLAPDPKISQNLGAPEPIFPDFMTQNSQNLRKVFFDAGAFYMARAEIFLEKTPIFTQNSVAMVLENSEICDINDENDWIEAKKKYHENFTKK